MGSQRRAPVWYFLLYAILAVYVLVDAGKRHNSRTGWPVATLLLGPVVLPVYFAKRHLKKGEVREGGTGWNVLKNFALMWTLTMAVAGVAGMGNRGSHPGSVPKYRCSAYASVASQDLPVLLGPTNTVNGRNSTHARATGPQSATSSVNGGSEGIGACVSRTTNNRPGIAAPVSSAPAHPHALRTVRQWAALLAGRHRG